MGKEGTGKGTVLPDIPAGWRGWGEEPLLYGAAGLIGVLTACAAVGFDKLVHVVDALSYGGPHATGLYQERRIFLFLLPAGGALLVGLIARYYSREAVGHGVPEVMDAIVRRDGRIKLHVALARMVTSAITIGSGGSAGTEGPIIQIGAAISSSTGRLFGRLRHYLPVLIGCGAAAGIAAIFNAPVAGVLFALEVFLRDINFRTLSPVLLAAVISSVVASALLGKYEAIFPLSDLAVYTFHWTELGNYILLGLLCAAVAVLFVRLLYMVEDFFDGLRIPFFVKPVLGALGLGTVGLLTVLLVRGAVRGEPIVFGNGYSFIGLCIGTESAERFEQVELHAGMLGFLVLAKVAATSLTLGSGGSGGVFAPSLFLGATTGYAFGLLLRRTEVFSDVSPSTYSLVGMASVVAAITHAPMAAIVLLVEITHNYTIILPVMFASTVALLIGQRFCRDSVDMVKLRRLGVQFGVHAQTAMLRRLSVRHILQPRVVTVPSDMPLKEIILATADEQASDFIVVDGKGRYRGLLNGKDLRNMLLHPEAIPLVIGEDMAREDVPLVRLDDTLDKLLELFSGLDVSSIPVCRDSTPDDFVGMVTREDLMRAYMNELERCG